MIFKVHRYDVWFRTSKLGYGVSINWGPLADAGILVTRGIYVRSVGPLTVYFDDRGRTAYCIGPFGVEFLRRKTS